MDAVDPKEELTVAAGTSRLPAAGNVVAVSAASPLWDNSDSRRAFATRVSAVERRTIASPHKFASLAKSSFRVIAALYFVIFSTGQQRSPAHRNANRPMGRHWRSCMEARSYSKKMNS
jgi:hypothetical protein